MAVAVPLLTPQFASIPYLGGMTIIGGDEKRAGAVLSLFVLAIVFVYEVIENGLPRLDVDQLRDEYVKQLMKKLPRDAEQHLRVNVMIARRRWYMLFIGREFQWTASRGFDPCHRDLKMWLPAWQGVCGVAFRDQQVKFVDLRGVPPLEASRWRFWQNPFHLFRWQLRRTQHVNAILSVPMVVRRGSGGNPTFAKVGVINVDAVSDEGAEFLAANWERMRKPLLEAGALLGAIR